MGFLFQAHEEKKEMEQLREYNKKLLYNILPVHVAQHFLNQKTKKNEVLCLSSFISRIFIICFSQESLYNLLLSNNDDKMLSTSKLSVV